MGRDGDIELRILESLQEKPRSISEIARELDEEKYEISKKIEVLIEQDKINTYRIGRSTACMLAEDTDINDEKPRAEEPEEPRVEPAPQEVSQQDSPADLVRESVEATKNKGLDISNEQSGERAPEPQKRQNTEEEQIEDWFDKAWESSQRDTEPSQNDNNKDNNDTRQKRPQTQENRGDGPRTIGIVSGKGGVGKTVVTLNLGAALMDQGRNVIVMDSDAEMPNVGLHLGMYTFPTSLEQVVEQDIHIMSAMHVDKDSGLRVIPTSLSREPVNEHVREAIKMIPDDYIVLIDSPPGYERPIERVIESCDELIFVTTPEIPSVTDTFKLAEEAKARGKNILGVVINMYSSPKKHLSVAEVEKSLEMPVLGVIDDSKLVQKSIFDTQPAVSMSPHAKPSREFKQMAADITGGTYDPSFFDRLRGLMP